MLQLDQNENIIFSQSNSRNNKKVPTLSIIFPCVCECPINVLLISIFQIKSITIVMYA